MTQSRSKCHIHVALPRTPGANNSTCEGLASSNGHHEVVALLGSRGANANAKDVHERTALHFAAENGHPAVCTALLSLGADPGAKDKYRETALGKAEEEDETECVALLEATME